MITFYYNIHTKIISLKLPKIIIFKSIILRVFDMADLHIVSEISSAISKLLLFG